MMRGTELGGWEYLMRPDRLGCRRWSSLHGEGGGQGCVSNPRAPERPTLRAAKVGAEEPPGLGLPMGLSYTCLRMKHQCSFTEGGALYPLILGGPYDSLGLQSAVGSLLTCDTWSRVGQPPATLKPQSPPQTSIILWAPCHAPLRDRPRHEE